MPVAPLAVMLPPVDTAALTETFPPAAVNTKLPVPLLVMPALINTLSAAVRVNFCALENAPEGSDTVIVPVSAPDAGLPTVVTSTLVLLSAPRIVVQVSSEGLADGLNMG